MIKPAYYNEIDEVAADWLRNLILFGLIAPGDVDTRSIEDVHPDDLKPYTQCHFFAGIGVWSRALRGAGWADDRPVWTASCPCQPFSAAGEGAGFADERHLWPAFFHLVTERRPAVTLGEQVASKDADPWVDLVCADMEALGHAFAAIPFPAASVGAPHIRDRTYWMGHSGDTRLPLRERLAVVGARWREQGRAIEQSGGAPGRMAHAQHGRLATGKSARGRAGAVVPSGVALGLADSSSGGWREERAHDRGLAAGNRTQGLATGSFDGGGSDRLGDTDPFGLREGHGQHAADEWATSVGLALPSGSDGLADADGDRLAPGRLSVRPWRQDEAAPFQLGYGEDLRPGPTNGYWRSADWLGCTDGKWRPVEPGASPLAARAAARVGRLRAYGNAINAQQAQIFIEEVMACL